MPENTFVPPTENGNNLAAMATPTQPPVVKLPEVGQNIVLQIHPWGGCNVIGDLKQVNPGQDVVVCEVKAIKKVIVGLE